MTQKKPRVQGAKLHRAPRQSLETHLQPGCVCEVVSMAGVSEMDRVESVGRGVCSSGGKF